MYVCDVIGIRKKFRVEKKIIKKWNKKAYHSYYILAPIEYAFVRMVLRGWGSSRHSPKKIRKKWGLPPPKKPFLPESLRRRRQQQQQKQPGRNFIVWILIPESNISISSQQPWNWIVVYWMLLWWWWRWRHQGSMPLSWCQRWFPKNLVRRRASNDPVRTSLVLVSISDRTWSCHFLKKKKNMFYGLSSSVDATK